MMIKSKKIDKVKNMSIYEIKIKKNDKKKSKKLLLLIKDFKAFLTNSINKKEFWQKF